MDCIDEYTHTSPQIMYFPRSFPTREVEDVLEPSPIFCSCEELCLEPLKCTCRRNSGTYYSFPDIKDLEKYNINHRKINMPTYECNEQCECKILCGNKLVQCGPRKSLKIKKCDDSNKGEGVFTENPIKSGNFICEYAGEIISETEASVRFKINAELHHMNYIFCIDEHFGEKNIKTFIDPTFYGNIGRYVNHSCDPNCIMLIIRINHNIPLLGLFAGKDIKAGEELSYDYGTTCGEECDERDAKRTKCLCKSKMCRGFLPYDSRFG